MTVSTTNIVTYLIIVAVALVIMPLGVIWAWNTLFGALVCSIAYTFPNWCAVILLGMFFRGIRHEKTSAQ
jgi:hypothetical protein